MPPLHLPPLCGLEPLGYLRQAHSAHKAIQDPGAWRVRTGSLHRKLQLSPDLSTLAFMDDGPLQLAPATGGQGCWQRLSDWVVHHPRSAVAWRPDSHAAAIVALQRQAVEGEEDYHPMRYEAAELLLLMAARPQAATASRRLQVATVPLPMVNTWSALEWSPCCAHIAVRVSDAWGDQPAACSIAIVPDSLPAAASWERPASATEASTCWAPDSAHHAMLAQEQLLRARTGPAGQPSLFRLPAAAAAAHSLLFLPWQPGRGHLLLQLPKFSWGRDAPDLACFVDCSLATPVEVGTQQLPDDSDMHHMACGLSHVALLLPRSRGPGVVRLFSVSGASLVPQRDLCPAHPALSARRACTSPTLLAFSPDGVHLALGAFGENTGAPEEATVVSEDVHVALVHTRSGRWAAKRLSPLRCPDSWQARWAGQQLQLYGRPRHPGYGNNLTHITCSGSTLCPRAQLILRLWDALVGEACGCWS